MNVKEEYPPNYDEVVMHFPAVAKRNVIFTYGRVIYNPKKINLTAALVTHEELHALRQTSDGMTPSLWWHKYFNDMDFRLGEEALAHHVEWMVMSKTLSRSMRRKALDIVARKLSAPIYGPMVTKQRAKKMLKDIDQMSGGLTEGDLTAGE